MKWKILIALVAAMAVIGVLSVTTDLSQIAAALGRVGWAIPLIVMLHLPQTLVTATGWSLLLPRPGRPALPRLYLIRWVKESVNALLPGGQMLGELVRTRLLAQKGVGLAQAAASCAVDVGAGALGLFAYLSLGLLFFAFSHQHDDGLDTAVRVVVVGGVLALLLALAPRLGLLRLLERQALQLSAKPAWRSLGRLSGLHEAVLNLYRDPARVALCGLGHLCAWTLGALETYVALVALGRQPSLMEVLVIDSLGQGARAAGFAIPGALGIQEGGYVLVCALFGIPAEQAVALSLVKRIRELVLGLPGLGLWFWLDIKASTSSARP